MEGERGGSLVGRGASGGERGKRRQHTRRRRRRHPPDRPTHNVMFVQPVLAACVQQAVVAVVVVALRAQRQEARPGVCAGVSFERAAVAPTRRRVARTQRRRRGGGQGACRRRGWGWMKGPASWSCPSLAHSCRVPPPSQPPPSSPGPRRAPSPAARTFVSTSTWSLLRRWCTLITR